MTAISYRFLNVDKFQTLNNWSATQAISNNDIFSKKYKFLRIGDLLKKSKLPILIQDNTTYKRVTIKLHGNGVKVRDTVLGEEIKTKRLFLLKKGQFVYSRIDARNGAFGLAKDDVDNAVITNDFPAFDVNNKLITTEFLSLITGSKPFFDFCQSMSSGTTGRQRMDENSFLSFQIPLPNLDTQNQLVSQYNKNLAKAQKSENQANELEKGIESYLLNELGIDAPKPVERKQGLQFIRLKEINSWSIDKILYDGENDFNEFQRLSNKINVESAFRGKSPKYADNGEATILNQKCNRWNEIKLEFAKSVDKKWFNSIDDKFKTVENDVLINSTGDGTIGRSSLVTKGFEGLIYDSHVLLVRLNQNLINPSFFVYQFNSAFIQSQIEQIKSAQSTKQTELGLDNLFKLNFKFPLLEIQTQIVNHITTQKEQIKNLRQQAEKLRKQAKENFEKEIFV
jgi:type I restriction enzyme, S subunit